MKSINKRTLVLTSVVILLPMFLGLALWNKLPEEVPTHFDFSGTPDGYSGRLFAVVGLPLFILACHLFSAVVMRADPKKQNISEKLMNIVLWICPVVSLYVSAMVYSYALGYAINAARAGTFLVGILFVVVGNYLPKCRQSYTVGIKLPWTLDDEDNWYHTHRFAGCVWMILGLAILIIGLLGSFPSILLAAPIAAVVLPTVYSFLYAKRHGKA